MASKLPKYVTLPPDRFGEFPSARRRSGGVGRVVWYLTHQVSEASDVCETWACYSDKPGDPSHWITIHAHGGMVHLDAPEQPLALAKVAVDFLRINRVGTR